MHEGQVKAATLAHVRKANGCRRKPIITAEFSLGSSGVRADIVVFAETTIGFEIKTAKDTLRRLPLQMKAYARYFNHAVAIVAPCHVSNVTNDHLYGASLWTYDEKGSLSLLHEGITNIVDNNALEDMMTQAEHRRGNFRAAMEARYGSTSQRFWEAVARRSIRADDLPLLSRFSDARAQARRWAGEYEAHWSNWLAAQAALPLHQPDQSSSVFSAAAGSL
jgi:hypothetical protein